MQVVVITGRRRPHEVMLIVLSLVWGVLGVFGAPEPDSLVAQVASWLVVAWSVLLLLSGMLGVTGIAWRGEMYRGLVLEQASMMSGAAATLIYAYALFSLPGWTGKFVAFLVSVWTAANLWRALQIRADLRAIRDAGEPWKT